MPTITPTITRDHVNGLAVISWSGIATGDTINSIDMGKLGLPAIFSAAQISGTFGGATVGLSGSNDDTTFVPLKDTGGSQIGATNDVIADVSAASQYLKPEIAGGTGDAVDVIMSVWTSRDFR